MAENYVILPTDAANTGKKLRTAEVTVGGQVVQMQYVALGSVPTYYIWVNDTQLGALAANKHWLSIANLAGSGRTVKIRKLFLQNLTLAAVTGVAIRLDVFKFSGPNLSAGTNITMESMDSQDSVPAQTAVKVVAGGTISALGNRLFAFATTNDEVGATNQFPTSILQAMSSLMAEGAEIRELVLREGEGMTLQQITSSTVGSFGVLAVVTIE